MLERRSEPQIIPSLRDGLVLHALQAINCLDFGELSRVATIIQSLRDARGYHSITPTRRHADTPTRPHALSPIRLSSVPFDRGGDCFRQVFTGAGLHYAGCFARVSQKAAFD